MEFVDLEQAKRRSGLRLVVVGGVPSPWSEAAKGILHVERVPFVAVRMRPGDTQLIEWTGQTSAPVAIYDDEAPRGGWAEILLLAERLAPTPSKAGQHGLLDVPAAAGRQCDQLFFGANPVFPDKRFKKMVLPFRKVVMTFLVLDRYPKYPQ